MNDGLNGGLIDPALPGGRAGAELRCDPVTRALVVLVDARAGVDPPLERALPLDGAQLQTGGASGAMLFLRHPAHAGLTVYTEDVGLIRVLRTARAWGGDEAAFVALDRTRRSSRIALPAWLGALIVAGFVLFRSVDVLVGLIPMDVDRKLGAVGESPLLSQAGGPAVHDPVVTAAVRKIMDRVVAAGPMPDLQVKVTVVDAPAVNAFALPGGFVVVYTGLLRDAASADEVAGVLAHELAHVTERHGLRRLVGSAGVVLVVDALLGDVAGLLGAARELFTLAAVNDYSRAQEEAADAIGVKTLHAAGIDPRASRDFFERLARSSEGLLDIDEALSWISTHPSHTERIDAIDAQLATLGAPVTRPLDVDWAAVRARLSDDDGASGVPGASPPALPAGARDAAPGGSPSDTAGAPAH